MIDCPKGEMRDRLPDFVHQQLGAAAWAEVSAHVATCSACAAEVTLLRELRATLRATPTVDVARIVAALPTATATRSTRPARVDERRIPRFDWRVAAAVTALAIGGASAAVWGRTDRDPGSRDVPVAEQPTGPRDSGPSDVGSQQVATADLSVDGELGEASAVELEALLRELESFDGLPADEPEPMLATPADEGLE